jgi:uncharacterized repeat protein (TIGR01451 family)
MERVPTLSDVGTFMKIIAAAVAVALVALGSMSTPAWAQDTTLSIDKSAEPDPVKEGNVLTYTVVVTNTGANEAENVGLTEDLDFGNKVDVGDVSATTTAGDCVVLPKETTGAFVTCQLGALAVGASATVTVELEPKTIGTITNTVLAGADNASEVEDTITTTVVPNLVIDKSSSVAQVEEGDPFSYTLRVTNEGETTAENVIVTDALPQRNSTNNAGVILNRFTSDDFSCEEDAYTIVCEGSLAAGETGTVSIFVEADSPLAPIFNTAEVRVQGVPNVISSDRVVTQVLAFSPEKPGEDNGKRVLVNHKGKELCLPKAALKGHERHGDEVISEEGCSNAASSAKKGKKGRNK